MGIEMTKRTSKIRGKVDFTTWELPQSIDFKIYEKLKDLSEDIDKLISKTANKHFNFERSVKSAASEAIGYALEYGATISFCEQKNPKIITVGFPIGDVEGNNVEWDVNFVEAIVSFSHMHTNYAVKDAEFREKYQGLITLLRESADILEKRYEKAKKEHEKQ